MCDDFDQYALPRPRGLTPSQYASISDANQVGLDFSDAITLSTWVKFESDRASGNTSFIAKRVSTGNQRSYRWYMGSPSSLGFEWMSTGLDGTGTYVTWNPATSTWYHLAVTKTGTTVKFYVNGTQQGTDQTGAFSAVFNGTAPFQVGGWSDGAPSHYIDGLIDDVRVWTRALSGSEITSLRIRRRSRTAATCRVGGNWRAGIRTRPGTGTP